MKKTNHSNTNYFKDFKLLKLQAFKELLLVLLEKLDFAKSALSTATTRTSVQTTSKSSLKTPTNALNMMSFMVNFFEAHFSKNMLIKVLSLGIFLSFLNTATAGTGGDEFADVWDTLKEWIQGTLGRVVCGSMILVGIVAGVARQSISAFAVGIGGGIGLYNTPTVIESVLSATISSLSASDLELLRQMAQ